MAKLKYDVTDVEDQDFEAVPPGLYTARIAEINERPAKSDGEPMLEIIYEIVDKKYKGSRVWDYIKQVESQAWKMKQFVKALALKEKGTLDTDKAVGTIVKIRTKTEGSEDSEYGISAKIKSVMPAGDDVAPDEDDLEEETGSEEEEDNLTYEELFELNRDELKEVIKENGLHEGDDRIKVLKKDSDEDIAAKIAEAFGLEPASEEEEEEEEEETEEEEEAEGYDGMSVADLRQMCKERGLKSTGAKKVLIKRLEEDDNSSGDENEEPF